MAPETTTSGHIVTTAADDLRVGFHVGRTGTRGSDSIIRQRRRALLRGIGVKDVRLSQSLLGNRVPCLSMALAAGGGLGMDRVGKPARGLSLRNGFVALRAARIWYLGRLGAREQHVSAEVCEHLGDHLWLVKKARGKARVHMAVDALGFLGMRAQAPCLVEGLHLVARVAEA